MLLTIIKDDHNFFSHKFFNGISHKEVKMFAFIVVVVIFTLLTNHQKPNKILKKMNLWQQTSQNLTNKIILLSPDLQKPRFM